MHIYIQHYSKNKENIYDEDVLQDIEFYSPTPFEDLVQLSQILNKTHKNIEVKEATHEMTYTLYVNFQAFCDASFMPKNIFSRV